MTNDRPIVVGGGAAGLAACLTLESQGHAPILLEASDRLGGGCGPGAWRMERPWMLGSRSC